MNSVLEVSEHRSSRPGQSGRGRRHAAVDVCPRDCRLRKSVGRADDAVRRVVFSFHYRGDAWNSCRQHTLTLPRQMVKCGPAGMRACSLGLVGLGFRVRDKVRDKVRVSVRDRVRC